MYPFGDIILKTRQLCYISFCVRAGNTEKPMVGGSFIPHFVPFSFPRIQMTTAAAAALGSSRCPSHCCCHPAGFRPTSFLLLLVVCRQSVVEQKKEFQNWTPLPRQFASLFKEWRRFQALNVISLFKTLKTFLNLSLVSSPFLLLEPSSLSSSHSIAPLSIHT